MAHNIHHNGFTSKAYGRNKRKYTARYFSRPHRQRSIQKNDNGGSMLVKIGICSLLAGLVLLSDFAGNAQIMETSSSTTHNTEDIGGDYLGKLRFVELPGIIQVFSSDARLRIGAEYNGYQLNADETVLTVSGISSKSFTSPADGTVKTLTYQNDKAIMELSVDGDMVISFAASGETAVEEGQPVKSGDTLYTAIESVDISMTKEGRPVNPSDYFNMRDQLLS